MRYSLAYKFTFDILAFSVRLPLYFSWAHKYLLICSTPPFWSVPKCTAC